MLTRLYIENIAVVEKAEIQFDTGLNILTGETGAGKSIIIDSINLILGRKISKDVIRFGKKNAFVSATFSSLSTDLFELINDYGIFVEDDDSLIIQRELNVDGKSVARVNGRPVALSVLKAIGDKLINIHGQHENIGLFSQRTHLNFIDEFGDLYDDLNLYRQSYEKLLSLSSQLDSLKVDESEKARQIDLLEYQIAELESAALKDGELETLEKERLALLNREKIITSFERIKSLLCGNEEESGAISLFELASDEFSELEGIYPSISELSERFRGLVYEIGDCQSELVSFSLDFDDGSNDLNYIEERLALLSNLSRKYGNTISDMLNFLSNAKTKLEKIQMSDHEVRKLQDEFSITEEQTKKLAVKLSDKRKNVSQDFIKKVKEELIFLDMPKVSIEVSHNKKSLDKHGCDEVEILISTNPGQPPKPVSKIASGGELSRLMLAIKNVLSNKTDVPTLIFDEIDTGISGSAAQKVGMKLKSLAKSRQVFCITHLAQIAVLADQHFLITKDVTENKTSTYVQQLDFESRKKEIARIIGGSHATELTLKNAEEMLKISYE